MCLLPVCDFCFLNYFSNEPQENTSESNSLRKQPVWLGKKKQKALSEIFYRVLNTSLHRASKPGEIETEC